MPKRLLVSIVCLHISAVLYVLLAGIILWLLKGTLTGAILAIVAALMAVAAEIVVFGLLRVKLWAWIAGVLLLSMYATSGFFFVGIPGLWGLASAETRNIFLKGSLEEKNALSLKARTNMVANKVIAVFGIIGVVGSVGWYMLASQTSTSVSPSPIVSSYVNEELGFAIRFPEGWIEEKQPDVVAYFYDPVSDEEGEYVYSANMNVMVGDASGRGLSEYADFVKQQRSAALDGYVFSFDQTVDVKGKTTRVLGDSFLIPVEDTDVLRVRSHVLIMIENDVVYIASGTALASAWDKQKKIIDAALNTFITGE